MTEFLITVALFLGFQLGTYYGKGFYRCLRFTYCKTKRITQRRYKPRKVNVR